MDFGIHRHIVARDDALDNAVAGEQRRIVMPLLAVEDAGASEGETIGHGSGSCTEGALDLPWRKEALRLAITRYVFFAP
jgi:hypothetical protein